MAVKSGAPASHDVFFKLDGFDQHIQITADTAEELFPKAKVVIDWLKEVGATNKDSYKSYSPTATTGNAQSANADVMVSAAQSTGFAVKACPVDGEPMKFVFKTGKMRSNAYVCETCGKWVNP